MNEKRVDELMDEVWDRVRVVLKDIYRKGYEQGQKDLREQEIEERDFHTVLREATSRWDLPEYHAIVHQEFVVNMHNKGYELMNYVGRNFYRGPAVVVSKRNKNVALADVGADCLTDDMGKHDVVVYPR